MNAGQKFILIGGVSVVLGLVIAGAVAYVCQPVQVERVGTTVSDSYEKQLELDAVGDEDQADASAFQSDAGTDAGK